MSQEYELPLLSSASYQRPTTSQQSNVNAQQPTAPITPPDTIRRSVSHESLKSASVSMTVTSDVSLTAQDIRDMKEELSEARQNNEIPHTTSSPVDAQVTVEDYGFLVRLREQRGNPTTPPSEAYARLHVEVARRIKERDAVLDENAVKAEAARRVSNYLSNLEHEQFIYNAATSAPSTPFPSVNGSSSSLVDAETFSEEVLSIIEQVADQTLIDATEPLRHHEKVMKIIDKCLREDSFALKDRIKALHSENDIHAALLKKHEASYNALLEKIEKEHQRHVMAFQLHDESLRNHDESLQGHDDSLRSLGNNLNDLGNLYGAQTAALGDHTQTFHQRLRVHNQLLDNQQDLNTSLLDQYRDIITSLQTMMQSQGQSTVISAQNLSTVSAIVNQLSAITMSIPTSINTAVAQSVQQQSQLAMQKILHAQQQAMLSLNEQDAQRRSHIDYDRLASEVAEQILMRKAAEVTKNKKTSRVRNAFRMLFCS